MACVVARSGAFLLALPSAMAPEDDDTSRSLLSPFSSIDRARGGLGPRCGRGDKSGAERGVSRDPQDVERAKAETPGDGIAAMASRSQRRICVPIIGENDERQIMKNE